MTVESIHVSPLFFSLIRSSIGWRRHFRTILTKKTLHKIVSNILLVTPSSGAKFTSNCFSYFQVLVYIGGSCPVFLFFDHTGIFVLSSTAAWLSSLVHPLGWRVCWSRHLNWENKNIETNWRRVARRRNNVYLHSAICSARQIRERNNRNV